MTAPVDTNLGFSMNVTFDYSSSGPLGNSIVTTNENGAVPGYVHVAAEYDSSLNLGAYNASQTSAHIGDDSSVNTVDWSSISGNSMTVTDQGSGRAWEHCHTQRRLPVEFRPCQRRQ